MRLPLNWPAACNSALKTRSCRGQEPRFDICPLKRPLCMNGSHRNPQYRNWFLRMTDGFFHWCVNLQETAPTTCWTLTRSSLCPGRWPCCIAPWWLRRSSTTRRTRTTSPGTTWRQAGKWARSPVESWCVGKLSGFSMWRWTTMENTWAYSGTGQGKQNIDVRFSHP